MSALLQFLRDSWPQVQMGLGGLCLGLFVAGSVSNGVRAIARNTMREELRKKILYFLIIFGILFISTSGALSRIQPGREGEAVAQTALFAVGLFGMLIAVFSATTVLFSEIRSRTIFILFSHPIGSFHIILGKFLGVVAILFVSIALMGAGLIIYFAFTPWFELVGIIIPALVLVFFQLFMLTAMCILGSTFLSRITNILLSMILFFVGSGYSFFKEVTDMMKVPIMKYYVQAFLAILPNFEKFSVGGKVFYKDFSLDATYVLSAVGDSLFRAAVMVAIGILFFRLKEVGTERWE